MRVLPAVGTAKSEREGRHIVAASVLVYGTSTGFRIDLLKSRARPERSSVFDVSWPFDRAASLINVSFLRLSKRGLRQVSYALRELGNARQFCLFHFDLPFPPVAINQRGTASSTRRRSSAAGSASNSTVGASLPNSFLKPLDRLSVSLIRCGGRLNSAISVE